jgi:hypothetical protein
LQVRLPVEGICISVHKECGNRYQFLCTVHDQLIQAVVCLVFLGVYAPTRWQGAGHCVQILTKRLVSETPRISTWKHHLRPKFCARHKFSSEIRMQVLLVCYFTSKMLQVYCSPLFQSSLIQRLYVSASETFFEFHAKYALC